MYTITCTTYRKDNSVVDSFVINYGAALEELGDMKFHQLLTNIQKKVVITSPCAEYSYVYSVE